MWSQVENDEDNVLILDQVEDDGEGDDQRRDWG